MKNSFSAEKVNDSFSYREIFGIALPLMIGGLSESVSAVVDTIYVGKLGKYAIDSVGLSSVILLLTIMIGWGAGRSLQIILSQKYGAKQHYQLGAILFSGLLFIGPIALLISALLYFFAPQIAGIIIQDTTIRQMSGELLRIRSLGLPLVMLVAILSSFWVSIGRTKTILVAQLMAALNNIVLNYFLIFGVDNFFPPLGYKGSAWATVFSELISFVAIGSAFFLFSESLGKYKLGLNHCLRIQLWKNLLYLSYPIWLQHAISLGSWLLFFALIERMGSAALAVSIILKQIFSLVAIPSFALANTSNSLIARLIGMNQLNKIIPTIHRISLISTGVLMASSLLIFLGRNVVFQIFTHETEVLSISFWPLIMLLGSFLILPYANVTFNSILAFGRTKVNLWLEFSTIFIYTLYMIIVILWLRLDLSWAWTSEIFYWIILFLNCWTYLKWSNWHERIRRY